MTDIEAIIYDSLMATRKGCEFKEAWIPEGWACVNIEKFSNLVAEKIQKEIEEWPAV